MNSLQFQSTPNRVTKVKQFLQELLRKEIIDFDLYDTEAIALSQFLQDGNISQNRQTEFLIE